MLQLEVIGNIGSDAEIKEFSGKKYVSFNIAHSERRKDANGTSVESTTWVSVLWYGDGGGLTQYLKRGCKVFVRGRLSVKTYQDRNGNIQVAVNVNASEVNLCGLKGEQSTASSSPAQQAADPAQSNDDLPF
ncbi:single-stranded DNA-binding protein [Bacteroidaceae bacterium]|nr:single-stranded DNA-binding protein [Bacteroidaceae bacterium]GFI38293.1 single-stranded DNA-binding protein [Muribaculaceae bacterium]